MLSDLASRFGVTLQELSGTSLAGELPLPASLVNRLVAQRLARANGAVAGVHVEPHDDQRITVTVSLRGQKLFPVVKVAARIEQQPQFPRPATLGLRWSLPALGPLALLAGPVAGFFKSLPRGVRLDGDRLSLDLRELLAEQGFGEIVDYITSLEIVTREGMFVVRFSTRISSTAQQ